MASKDLIHLCIDANYEFDESIFNLFHGIIVIGHVEYNAMRFAVITFDIQKFNYVSSICSNK